MLVDTHCHLTHHRFADRDAVIARAQAAGVTRLITIGTGIHDARAAIALAQAHPGTVSATAGLDPHSCLEAGDAFPERLAELAALAQQRAIVAIGEIGLEYHHQVLPHPVQRRQCEAQLALAVAHDLPVVLHVREAHADMLAILPDHPRARGVIHSFDGTPAEVDAYLALGWHVALNGMVTFKPKQALREACARIPADRLLLETDAPYLAPVPLRGTRCEPAHVVHTLALVAAVRAARSEDVAAWTTRTAERLFRLPPAPPGGLGTTSPPPGSGGDGTVPTP